MGWMWLRRAVAMGAVIMAVGMPVVMSMVVGMGHPTMLYYNITKVHA